MKLITQLTSDMQSIFADNFGRIAENFSRIFTELFDGGRAELTLTDPGSVLESGIEIYVQPPGKIIKNLAALSGGEQAFVAIAIYFAILKVRPSPFCLLDEIEAALGRRERRQIRAVSAHDVRQDPVHHDHPPARHDGGSGHALRRDDAGGGRVQAA